MRFSTGAILSVGSALLLGSVSTGFAPVPASGGVTITITPNKAVHPAGEEVTFAVRGAPNTMTILAADPDPGPTMFPFGTMNIGLSPLLHKFEGRSNSEGLFVIREDGSQY